VDDAALSAARLTMRARVRRSLHWAGSALAAAATAFVALRAHEYWRELGQFHASSATWTLVFVLALLYGAANLLLASAWRHLLARHGVRATRIWSIRLYGVSQLAKYIPGNVFHLAGRQAMGMAAGAAGLPLARSIIEELVLIATAGLLYGWLALPLFAPRLPWPACVAAFIGTLWLAALLSHRIGGPHASAALVRQMLFLAVSGAVFAVLLDAMAGASAFAMRDWLLIGAVYVAAWLGGLLTPGAPAGIGVRESILLLLLDGVAADAAVLRAVALGRLVTVVGDLLFFAAACLIPADRAVLGEHHG
jgi:hypothetical protein